MKKLGRVFYKTKINKYGLNFIIYIADTGPNILLQYNNLYMDCVLKRHLIFGHQLVINNITDMPGITLYPVDSVIIDDTLEDIADVYYSLYEHWKELTAYNILMNDIKFRMGWFGKKRSDSGEPIYVLGVETLASECRDKGLTSELASNVFDLLKDLDTSETYTDNTRTIFSTWTIKSSLFEKLPGDFTIRDLLPVVRDEVEKRLLNKERIWHNIAKQHEKKEPVLIPIVIANKIRPNSAPPVLVKYYIEQVNKYGIYQGTIIDPTCKYNKLLLGDRDNGERSL